MNIKLGWDGDINIEGELSISVYSEGLGKGYEMNIANRCENITFGLEHLDWLIKSLQLIKLISETESSFYGKKTIR